MAGVALGVAVLFASLSAGATMDAAVARAAADEMGRAAVRVEALEEHGLSRDSLAAIAGTAGVDVVAPALERKTYLAASPSLSPAAEPPAPTMRGGSLGNCSFVTETTRDRTAARAP